jgi:uncharacterized protein (DUF1015 family)
MPEIKPFRGIRYDFARFGGDLSAVIAPPYDVLDKKDKAALLARSPFNIVAVDLPHIPPKEEGPQQAYLDAQFTLDGWINDGVLVTEDAPALYVYHQTFEHEGKQLTRRQFIAAVRLHPFEEGVVLPHEKTFGGPKADRLALMKETGCNMSPVFGLFTDPQAEVAKAFASVTSRKPDATSTLEQVRNDLWVSKDAAIASKVAALLRGKHVYIADGHHRYTTALNYRDHLAGMQGGKLPDDHPANYVMVVLASMDDPGCVIHGYCRVLVGEGLTADALVAAWKDGTTTSKPSDADLDLYDGKSKKHTHLRFTNRAALDKVAPEHDASWRKLDVAYLHRYLLDELATKAFPHPPDVRYEKSTAAACALAEQTGGVALIPKAVPMAQLRAVSEAGELMPQKSTFFYPKLATGLTIYRLTTDL